MLSEDLKSLSRWITNSKMLKSSVMWFSVRPLQSVTLPSIHVDGHPLECVDTQKHLGLHIDSKLSWRSHVAIYLIEYHQSILPASIIKMLMESLVMSHLNYALSVWGPSLNKDLFSCLCRLYNRAVRVTCGLRKYDHISNCRFGLRWLPLDLLIQHRALNVMYR